MLAKLRLPCTPLSDGCFGVLAGTFPLCQQPHSLSLTCSPGICPISSDQSKSKNAAPVPVRSFRLNQVPSRCQFTAVGTDACRDSSSPTTEMANACGRVFRQSTKRRGRLRWPLDKSQQAWRQATGLSIAEREAYDAAKAILPLTGDPLRKEGAQFHPLFELTLPKEYWRDSNEENESALEED
jgi:hypothetical protein